MRLMLQMPLDGSGVNDSSLSLYSGRGEPTAVRTAATLVEVLVAIFVMAIGLLALLSLFPLGIIRMAQAIQDGRTAQTAANADEIALLKQVRYDPLFQSLFTTPNDPINPASPLPLDPDGASYAVLVDSMGYISSSAVGQIWLANDQNTNIQRSSVSYVGNTFSLAQRWFTLLDDLTFDIDGTAQKVGGTVEREINYSWAYLVQRPRASDPAVVNLQVVVFKGRSVSLTGDLTLSEYSYSGATGTAGSAYFNPTNNTVLFDYSGSGNTPPPVRAGDWLLDCTPVLTRKDPDPMKPGQRILADTTNAEFRTAHANFYRIVGVDEISDTQIEVEVETPLIGFPADAFPVDPTTNAYRGVAVIMENVVEVFPKGPGRRP